MLLLDHRDPLPTKTAHDSYEAWREGDHDDLVIAVAMACWIIEYYGGAGDDEYFLEDELGWEDDGEEDWD